MGLVPGGLRKQAAGSSFTPPFQMEKTLRAILL
jgi:hypothetical protein